MLGGGQCGDVQPRFDLGGVKTITATYAGDANYNGSTSSGVSHTVNKADTTTVITNAVALGTPTVVGQAYAVNWSVTVNSPGALGVALTGNVTVDAGGGNTCTAAVSAGTCNIVSTTAGVKSITATYAGDANYNGSASSPATPHTVNKADTTTTITKRGDAQQHADRRWRSLCRELERDGQCARRFGRGPDRQCHGQRRPG